MPAFGFIAVERLESSAFLPVRSRITTGSSSRTAPICSARSSWISKRALSAQSASADEIRLGLHPKPAAQASKSDNKSSQSRAVKDQVSRGRRKAPGDAEADVEVPVRV